MLTAKDVMSTELIAADPEQDVLKAAKIMLDNRINGLPVIDRDGKLLGIITQSDLIAQQKTMRLPSVFTILDGIVPLTSTKYLEDEIRKMSALKVEDAMTKKVVSVAPDTGVNELATIMVEKKFHTLPVIENERLVGVVGKEDVLNTLLSSGGED
jgi:CBS domain-containing protein